MKQELRQMLKKIRDGIPSSQKLALEHKISRHIASYIEKNSFTIVAYYYPINSEVRIIDAFQKINVQTSLPKLENDILKFAQWKPGEKLAKNQSFFEPKSTNYIIPELIIMPCLGYNLDGYRLGYGKGHYDKSLDLYPNAKKIITAFSAQLCDALNPDEWDIKADGIINENGFISIKNH